MSILENLYSGNINLVEKSIKKGSEYEKLTRLSLELESKFIKGKGK